MLRKYLTWRPQFTLRRKIKPGSLCRSPYHTRICDSSRQTYRGAIKSMLLRKYTSTPLGCLSTSHGHDAPRIQIATDQNYRYSRLASSTYIRILHLCPGKSDEPLQGRLEQTNVGDGTAIGYTALSYVWGSKTKEATLKLGGKYLPLTKNLNVALRRFRDTHRVVTLWADAVCIDQMNIQERAQQIGMIGRIYSKAHRVVAWLGPDPEQRASELFQLIRLTSYRHGDGAGIEELTKLDWFSRLWVIQEALLAQNAEFIWGNDSIPLDLVQQNAQWYNLRLAHNDIVWIGDLPSKRRDMDLIKVLNWSRKLSCSDDRDRVYAVLNLPFEGVSSIASRIMVDYTLPAHDLFYHVAQECVHCGMLPRLWTTVQHGDHWDPSTANLPSWVPDWTLPPRQFHRNYDLYDGMEYPTAPLRNTIEPVTRGLSVQGLVLSTTIPVVRVKTTKSFNQESLERACKEYSGYPQDTIEGLASFWQTLASLATFWKHNVQSMADKRRDSLDHGQTLLFVEMLLACTRGCHAQAHTRFFALAKSMARQFQYFETMLTDIPISLCEMFEDLEASLEKVQDQYPLYDSGVDDLLCSAFASELSRIWQGHELFVTSAGDTVLAPKASRPEDLVVIIAGCQYPAVLRRHKSWYYFVGCAYMSDVRHADVLEVWNAKEERLQHFEIR